MRILLTTLLLGTALVSAAHAQDMNSVLQSITEEEAITAATPPQAAPATAPVPTTPAPTTPAPGTASVTTMPAVPGTTEEQPQPVFEKTKFAVLQTLDKVTARTNTVTIPVGQPSAVGPIFIDVKTCQKTPPTEQPESAAFLQVWEAKPKSHEKNAAARTDKVESQWVFSGWMFASSPALSAMNHPIYDVWVKDCTNSTAVAKSK